MSDVSASSTAMLIVKVRREAGSIRATVSSSPDVLTTRPTDRGQPADTEEVLKMVDDWLRSIGFPHEAGHRSTPASSANPADGSSPKVWKISSR